MFDIVGIGFFLYSLLGAIPLGYLVLSLLYSSQFRAREVMARLKLGAIAGMVVVLVIGIASVGVSIWGGISLTLAFFFGASGVFGAVLLVSLIKSIHAHYQLQKTDAVQSINAEKQSSERVSEMNSEMGSGLFSSGKTSAESPPDISNAWDAAPAKTKAREGALFSAASEKSDSTPKEDLNAKAPSPSVSLPMTPSESQKIKQSIEETFKPGPEKKPAESAKEVSDSQDDLSLTDWPDTNQEESKSIESEEKPASSAQEKGALEREIDAETNGFRPRKPTDSELEEWKKKLRRNLNAGDEKENTEK